MAESAVNNNNEGEEEDNRKILLKSNEGGVFSCRRVAAMMSELIQKMVEALGTDYDPKNAIPLTNDAITDKALERIISWCEYHWDDPPLDPDFDDEMERRNEELCHWDKQFINIADMAELYDVICGANYLDIKGLVEVGGKHICSLIKGKSVQEVRDLLKIENDFTPEEEEAIRKENEWIYAKD